MTNPLELLDQLVNSIPSGKSFAMQTEKGDIIDLNVAAEKGIQGVLIERTPEAAKENVINELFGEGLTAAKYLAYVDTFNKLNKLIINSVSAPHRMYLKKSDKTNLEFQLGAITDKRGIKS